VAGLDAVLWMLYQQRVKVLMVAQGARLPAGVCPRCSCPATSRLRCPFDGARLTFVDGVDLATELAIDQFAQVAILRHETSALLSQGSIAALLRPSPGSHPNQALPCRSVA
jgi:hypothetical protein